MYLLRTLNCMFNFYSIPHIIIKINNINLHCMIQMLLVDSKFGDVLNVKINGDVLPLWRCFKNCWNLYKQTPLAQSISNRQPNSARGSLECDHWQTEHHNQLQQNFSHCNILRYINRQKVIKFICSHLLPMHRQNWCCSMLLLERIVDAESDSLYESPKSFARLFVKREADLNTNPRQAPAKFHRKLTCAKHPS